MAQKRIRKTGMPPGSLIYTGTQTSDVIISHLVRYNAETVEEISLDTFNEPSPNAFYWLDVRGTHNPLVIEAIGKKFNIDYLLLEDILDPGHRPKLEHGDNSIFIILKNLIPGTKGGQFLSEHICLYLTDQVLISFQEYPDDSFQSINLRMQQPTSRVRTRKPDYLMYAIIDYITDHYFAVLDSCSDRIHELETAINSDPDEALKRLIYRVRQDIAEMHRIVQPTREAISALQRTESLLIADKTKRYLRDIMDHIMQILDINDNQSDHVSSLHDLFMSEITYRMTNVMKILTVVTSIFIPLTFITSIYGMNFKFMPELTTKWGYPMVWVIMIIVSIISIVYFKRKKWL
jgi:magnesium transporter